MSRRYPNKKRGYPFKRIFKRKLRRITYLVLAAAVASGVTYYKKNYSNQSATVSTQTNTRLDNSASGSLSDSSSLGSSVSNKAQQQAVKKIRAAAKNTNAQFWITVKGIVVKNLKDDRKGSQHQKFLIKIASDITLLVAHNIDLAQRAPVKKGDKVSLRGRYEWNNRGGVMHWTHHDPKGRKQGGWIEVNGKRYR